MRQQGIRRVVDARAGQDRVIVHLDCRHTVSLTTEELAAVPMTADALGLTGHARVLTAWPCDTCPDPSEDEARLDKHPTQLWREAGEP